MSWFLLQASTLLVSVALCTLNMPIIWMKCIGYDCPILDCYCHSEAQGRVAVLRLVFQVMQSVGRKTTS